MGQAAIQAGVPVDVRLEIPTHLSFQVSVLCHATLYVTATLCYTMLCVTLYEGVMTSAVSHLMLLTHQSNVGLTSWVVWHCCSSSAISSAHLQITFSEIS